MKDGLKKGESYKKYKKNKDRTIRFRASDEDYENLWKLQRELGLDMSASIRIALSVACDKLFSKKKSGHF